MLQTLYNNCSKILMQNKTQNKAMNLLSKPETIFHIRDIGVGHELIKPSQLLP